MNIIKSYIKTPTLNLTNVLRMLELSIFTLNYLEKHTNMFTVRVKLCSIKKKLLRFYGILVHLLV